MKLQYIKNSVILGCLIIGMCCVVSSRADARALPPGPVGMVDRVSFDMNYLIMDGASNDNYNEGMKIVKERETMLQDIFDIYNNNIRAYALKNPN